MRSGQRRPATARRAAIALVGTAVVGLVGACGGDRHDDPPRAAVAEGTSDAAAATAPSARDDPSGDPAGGLPPFSPGGAARTAESSGAWDLVLTDVRAADHEGFDRIVLEFSGTGTPGWSVAYVDEAALDGSGEVVPLRGDAILDIYASGTTWPAAGYYDGPRRVAPEDGEILADMYVGGTFEGYTQVLAGIRGAPAPSRVFALSGPPRLVVDVNDVAD